VRETRLEQKLKETKCIFYVLFAFSVSVTILKVIVGRKQKWPEGVCLFPDLLIFVNNEKNSAVYATREPHICNGVLNAAHVFNSLSL